MTQNQTLTLSKISSSYKLMVNLQCAGHIYTKILIAELIAIYLKPFKISDTFLAQLFRGENPKRSVALFRKLMDSDKSVNILNIVLLLIFNEKHLNLTIGFDQIFTNCQHKSV